MANQAILSVQPLGFPWKTQDPFLFCVYHKDDYPKGNDQMGPDASLAGRNLGQDFVLKDGWRMYHGQVVPGFPAHPHRGFETVTIVEKGYVDHSDSMGATARFGHGDVQWLTSGKGLQHSEMFPLTRQDEPNPLVLFQLWLNLPAKSKFVEPHFKMLWSETIPMVIHKDGNNKTTQIAIIAGHMAGEKAPEPSPNSWAADPDNKVGIFTIKLEAGATWKLPATSPDVNRTLYYYKGKSLKIAGMQMQPDHSFELNPASDIQLTNDSEESWLLLLQGKPINEPVVQHGPFVMNSREEVMEAFKDFQSTQFGGWPWDNPSPVHDRKKGRFARHADGKTEEIAL